MRFPRGFGARIQVALMLTTAIPLLVGMGVSYMMLGAALGDEELPEVSAALEESVEAYRLLFKARREANELRADLLAATPALRDPAADPEAIRALLREACLADTSLVRAGVLPRGGPPVEAACIAEAAPGLREIILKRSLGKAGQLRLTFGLSERAYSGLERAGTVARAWERERTLRKNRMGAYWITFGVLFGAGVLLSGILGMRMARRTTRRIEALAAATHRFSRGALDVEVPVDGVDELAELAAAFNLMVREVRERGHRIAYLEKISSWQEIARRLAHEIKNPLTPIQLAVQQLRSGYRGDDPRFARLLEEVGNIVREEVETLRRLVSEFSEFARLPDVSPEPTDLGAWVTDFVRQHPDLCHEAAIDLDAPAVPVKAMVDRTLLGRVLTNLVQNAIQAAEEAGQIPKVHLRVAATLQGALLVIEDEGPGIPEDLVGRIFDPYFTTKQTGTGLGLPICKKIVLQHDGEITVTSRLGHGARFEIRLTQPALAAA